MTTGKFDILDVDHITGHEHQWFNTEQLVALGNHRILLKLILGEYPSMPEILKPLAQAEIYDPDLLTWNPLISVNCHSTPYQESYIQEIRDAKDQITDPKLLKDTLDAIVEKHMVDLRERLMKKVSAILSRTL